MKLLKVLIGIVAVVAVVGLLLPLSGVGPKGDQGNPGDPGKDGHSPVVKMVGDRLSVNGVLSSSLRGAPGKDAVSFGAVASPDIPSPWIKWGGVRIFNASQSFNQGSTTACSIQAPIATSTLIAATVQLTEATSTTVMVSIGRSVFEDTATTTLWDKAATTTATFEWAYNLNKDDDFNPSFVASTTPYAEDGDVIIEGRPIFLPNETLNIKLASKNLEASATAGDTFNLDGTCNATWETL